MNKIIKSLEPTARTFASYFIENSILQKYPDLLLINQENNSTTLDKAYNDLETLIKNLIAEYRQQEQTTEFQEIQKNSKRLSLTIFFPKYLTILFLGLKRITCIMFK